VVRGVQTNILRWPFPWITWFSLFMIIAACILSVWFIANHPAGPVKNGAVSPGQRIPLPAPATTGEVSVEEAVAGRRSVRGYAASPLQVSEISQILWAAQGLTDPSGLRAAPSAGALYPLEIYLASGEVTGLPAGVYHYLPELHAMDQVSGRDARGDLYQKALRQSPVRDAPAVIIIAADYQRTTGKYGERGIRYVHLEAGHAAQNICLQAYALGIGTVTIGAFDDQGISSAIGLPANQTPLYLMPIGRMNA
jgi:SagB-type dehydrogenase family enzyme